MWINYPGPVFNTWKEAKTFIETVDEAALDQIQSEVMLWYEEFKFFHKTRVISYIRSQYGIPESPPNETLVPGSTSLDNIDILPDSAISQQVLIL